MWTLPSTNLDAIVDYGYESTDGQFNVDVYVSGANRGRANHQEFFFPLSNLQTPRSPASPPRR